MFTLAKSSGKAALALAAVLVFAEMAPAQIMVTNKGPFPINPNPQIAPGVSLLQYAYNTAVLGRAYNQTPVFLLGNRYPTVVTPPVAPAAVSPAYGAGAAYGGYSPYGAAPYGGGYAAAGIDPLTGLPGGGYSGVAPYGGYGGYSPFLGAGGELVGLGQLGIDQEKARIMREYALQAKLDTRKKTIDTLAYIRAHEYTFTQEQADIAKRLLARVQKTPTVSEVYSGKSLNIMLEDLVKFNNQELRGPTISLDDDVVKLVNIQGAGSGGNVGLLRDNGRIMWPAGFDNKDIVSEKDRKDLELEAMQLYKLALNGQPDGNLLRNVESALQTMRANLGKQVNKMPSQNYLAAQRFLDEFDAAVVGIKKGDVVLNWDFQQFIAKGGKTLQELVDYMGKKGLRFAPATSGDERAYVALQAAMAAQSVAINSQVASAGKSN